MQPHKSTLLVRVIVVLALGASKLVADPLGTAFTYQGRLQDGASPAHGSYDFRFGIYDAEAGGSPQAPLFSQVAAPVTGGLFTVTLNFGTGVFTGDARWLEIGVRTNGSADDFTTLSPRQPITPSPYALYAPSAGTAVTASNALPGSIGTAALAVDAVDSSRIAEGSIAASDLSPTVLSGTFWRLNGNMGTAPGAQFLGTTDDQPLEFKVNGLRAGRLEFTGDSCEDSGTVSDGAPNVILGAPINFVAAGAVGATIAGGGATNLDGLAYSNSILASYAVIGGGLGNRIASNAIFSTVAGGLANDIGPSSDCAVVGGGSHNTIATHAEGATLAGGAWNVIGTNSSFGVIGGGGNNTVAADSEAGTIAGGGFNAIGTDTDYSTIGGGQDNVVRANALYATIPGGRGNTATNYAFAAGRRAKANHQGAFVWGDSHNADITSTNANSVTLRAAGGYRLYSNSGTTAGVHLAPGGGSWTSMSDRNAKENFTSVNTQDVLAKVAALPLTTWRYKSQDRSIRHLGPMSQDFHAAFGLGESDTGITAVDADGVALAAIQGLNEKVESGKQTTESRMETLETENAALKQEVAELKALVQTLAEKVNGDGQ